MSQFPFKFLLGASFFALSPLTFAQQSLFNVPSVETTEKDRIFFQEQVNLLSIGTANTTLDYGLGNGWEMGLSFFNLDFYSRKAEPWANPKVLLNIQKGFHVTDNWKVGIGTQTGFSTPLHEAKTRLSSFSYWNNSVDFKEWGKYYLGVYYANRDFTGGGTNVNLMAGIEFPLTEKVSFMADFINGNSAISGAVIGAVWYATKQWQFSLGSLISTPTQAANRVEGAVLEFTFVE